jgi:hypothetical protein
VDRELFVATNIPKRVEITPKRDIKALMISGLVITNSRSNVRKEPRMPVPASQAPFANATQRREVVLGEANLAIARDWADSFGVPLAYLYADNADLAEVILAFGLLPESEQRRLALELKARVSPPATRARPARKARAKPRTG